MGGGGWGFQRVDKGVLSIWGLVEEICSTMTTEYVIPAKAKKEERKKNNMVESGPKNIQHQGLAGRHRPNY